MAAHAASTKLAHVWWRLSASAISTMAFSSDAINMLSSETNVCFNNNYTETEHFCIIPGKKFQ